MKYELSKELVDAIIENLLEQPARLSYHILTALKIEIEAGRAKAAEDEAA